MSAAFIIIPGVCYALQALLCARQQNWPMVIVYSGYAWENAGLWLLDRLMQK